MLPTLYRLKIINMSPTNLPICDTDESLIDQFVSQWVPGLALHNVALCCFISERDGWYLPGETATQLLPCYADNVNVCILC